MRNKRNGIEAVYVYPFFTFGLTSPESVIPLAPSAHANPRSELTTLAQNMRNVNAYASRYETHGTTGSTKLRARPSFLLASVLRQVEVHCLERLPRRISRPTAPRPRKTIDVGSGIIVVVSSRV